MLQLSSTPLYLETMAVTGIDPSEQLGHDDRVNDILHRDAERKLKDRALSSGPRKRGRR